MADIPGDNTTNKTLQRDKAKSSSIGPAGDQDWFKVNLKANNEYSFQVKGRATGQGFTLGDPSVSLIDTDGSTLLAQDSDGGIGSNALLTYTPDENGTYYLCAEGEFGTTGSYKASYQLVDQAPRDLDDNGVDTEKSIKIGQTQTGSIRPTGDDDWFKVNLKPGIYLAEARNRNTDGPFVADVHVYDDTASLVDGNSSPAIFGGTGRNNFFVITEAGNYFLDVRDLDDTNTGDYRLTLTRSLVS